MSMDLARLLELSAPRGVEWAGIRRVRSVERSFAAQDGAYDAASLSEEEGFFVEVLEGGSFGYAAVASCEPSVLGLAFLRARRLAQASARWPLHSFSAAARPASSRSWESPRVHKAELGADSLMDLAVSLTKTMALSDKIIQASVEFSTRDLEIELASTSGARLSQTLHLTSEDLGVVAREGSVIQKRSLNGRARLRQGGSELFDRGELELSAEKVAREALELLGAEDCPAMTGDLVLAPDQMNLQIHESVGHPCELDRILGDERNFAGFSFVRLEDVGSLRYGSPLMNIVFEPGVPGESASYAFDDTGLPAQREYLIKEGILVRALGGIESQLRSGKPGVANQRADNWSRAPIDRMANVNLEPGKDSFEDIIGGIEKGVYMETNRSWSIDDYRNKFQFGCEYAKLIEKGRITRTLKNPNYRGISSTFWRSLYKVGDESTRLVLGTGNCGKGEPNQVIFVGHASPVCAFKDVEIFGGQS